MAGNWILWTLLVSLSGCASAPRAEAEANVAIPPAEELDQVAGITYRNRYALPDASAKLVDNQGNGRAELYGVRNFRAVLSGIYYRGGANNAYNKHEKRGNSNPLPAAGLENLCREGFSEAVYLYPTNYGASAKSVRCRTYQGNENVLTYEQISPLKYQRADQQKLLNLIYDRIRNPRLGPIYDHCWNGWHASGFVAAITLRQFCGFSKEQAVAYWNKNTDGNNGNSKNYNKLRAQIAAFAPFPELTLTDAEKHQLCPEPSTLRFR
ncbi:MAG: hypothetical protein EOP11_20375 [Proteobacteria bacterium]|nr:MAG: hypothetical protein EOP11_20375 [Pseudomonadota bacterium]